MSRGTIRGITVKIDGETTGLQAAMKDVNQEAANISKELRKIEDMLKFNPKDTELLAQKQKLLADRVENTSDKLETLKKAQAEVNEQFKKGEISEAQHRAFQRELIKTESQLRNFQKQLRQANIEADEFKQRMDKAAKSLESAGRQMGDMGSKLSKLLTVPLTAMAGLAGKIGADVQVVMSDIGKATGATGKELDRLKGSFEEIAKSVPQDMQASAQATATWYRQLGKADEVLEAIVQQSMDFARANKEDVGPTTQNLVRLMNALEMEVSEMPGVMDKLTRAAQLSGLGVNELIGYIIDAGPAFEEMGFNFDRSIGLFAEFHQAGANPREVLSSLNIVLNKMAQDGAKNAEEAFNMLLSRIKAAPEILSATTIASEAFGARVGSKVAEDIRAGRFEVDAWVAALQDAEGAVDQTIRETETIGDRFAQIGNRMKVAIAPIGEALVGAFEHAIEAMGPFIEKIEALSKRFKELSPRMQTTILAIAGIIAAIGPALMIFGKLSTGVGAALKTLGTLVAFIKTALIPAITSISLPVVAVVAGIAALAAIAYEVYRAWDEVKAALAATWEYLKAKASGMGISIAKIFEEMKLSLFESIDGILEKFAALENLPFGWGEKFKGVVDFVGDSVDKSRDKLDELALAAQENADRMEEATSQMKIGWSDLASKVGEDIQAVIDKIRGKTASASTEESELEDELEGLLKRIEDYETEYTELVQQGEEERNEITNEEAAKQAEERERFEKQWNKKLFELTADRLEKLEAEYLEALSQAEKHGADKVAIEEYYQTVREQMRQEELEKEEERVRQFEQEWLRRVGEPIKSPQEMLLDLERERLIALEEAKQLGADITNITKYYAQKRLELELQIAEQQLSIWERIERSLKDPIENLKSSLLSASEDIMTFATAIFSGDIYQAIGVLLKESKVLEMILDGLQKFLQPLTILLDTVLMLNPAIQLLMGVFGLFEGLISGLMQLWNAVIDSLSSIEIFGWKPFAHMEKYKREEPKGSKSGSSGGGHSRGGRQYSEISGPARDALTDALAPLAQLSQIVSPIRNIDMNVAAINAKLPSLNNFALPGVSPALAGAAGGGYSVTIRELNVNTSASPTAANIAGLTVGEIEKQLAKVIAGQQRGGG